MPMQNNLLIYSNQAHQAYLLKIILTVIRKHIFKPFMYEIMFENHLSIPSFHAISTAI